MAKKGKSFKDYGQSVQSSIIQNIIRGQSGTASGATTTGNPVSTQESGNMSYGANKKRQDYDTTRELRELKEQKAIAEYQAMTPEERAVKYANDPVLSGKFTNIQDTLAGLYKVQSVQNLLPVYNDPDYAKKMIAYNKAEATLTQSDIDAAKAFRLLGGTFTDKNTGQTSQWGTQNILDKWLGRTTPTQGLNLNVQQITNSASKYATALPGMNQKTGQMNLTMKQLGKLRELRGVKQAGGTLTAKQRAKLERLKALKNAP